MPGAPGEATVGGAPRDASQRRRWPQQLPDLLTIPRGCLEAGLESLLKAAGGNLLILRISHCPNILTDRSLWLASCYCRALQAVTYRWVHSTRHKAHTLLASGPRDPWTLKAKGLKSLWPQRREQRAIRVGCPSFVFSTGAPQTRWATRSFGPWVQAAERLSPSRWHHFTPGEPWQGWGRGKVGQGLGLRIEQAWAHTISWLGRQVHIINLFLGVRSRA